MEKTKIKIVRAPNYVLLTNLNTSCSCLIIKDAKINKRINDPNGNIVVFKFSVYVSLGLVSCLAMDLAGSDNFVFVS